MSLENVRAGQHITAETDAARLAQAMLDMAAGYRADAVKLNDAERYALLLAAAELAGEMAKDVPVRPEPCPVNRGGRHVYEHYIRSTGALECACGAEH